MIKREKVKNLSIINKQTIECFNEYNTIEYFDTGSVHEGVFDVPAILDLQSDKIPSRAKRVVKDNTIIISSVRPNLKHYAIFKNPKPNTIVSTGFVTIDANQNMNPLYLYYVLTNDDTTKFLINIANTSVSSYPSFKPNDIGEYEIEYDDDLNMQNKIVDIIKPIDDRINLNDNIINKLESMMKDIYDYWFVQFDFPNEKRKPYKSSGGKMVYNEKLKREIPEIFKIEKLCDITNIYQPKTISEKDLDKKGQYFVYGANGIIGKYNKYNHECNEVAVCCRGASCGNLLMTLPYSWITGNSMVVSPIENLNLKEYVYYYLVKYGLKKYVTGSAQPQITRANIEKMDIVLPNNDLLNTFNDIALTIRKKIIKLILENNMLKEYKNFILPLLMNGQVEIM